MTDILIILLAFAAYSLMHSLLSTNLLKDFVRRHWPEYFFFYRLAYTITQTAALVVLWIVLPKPQATVWAVNGILSYLFRLVQILALLGIYKSARQFSLAEFIGLAQIKRRLSGEKVPARDAVYKLNTTGMFAVSRNPLYLFTIILLLFQPVMTLFRFLVLGWVILYFFIGSLFEEKRLLLEFGSEYRNYRAAVSGILPWKWFIGKLKAK